jgi:hypothetical protein
VTAVITDTTLAALPDILDSGQDGYHDTQPASSAIIGDLAEPPLAAPNAHLGRLELGLRPRLRMGVRLSAPLGTLSGAAA